MQQETRNHLVTDRRGRYELFEANLGLITEIIDWICHRHALRGSEAEDFKSYAQIRLLEDDCAVIRKFRGSSTLKTYLTTVIRRLFLDYRIGHWGKWRPSAEAKRRGTVAMHLERLLVRDGHSLAEAVEILKRNERVETPRSELYDLAAHLPRRTTRCFESLEEISALPAAERAESALEEGERLSAARTAESVLAEMLAAMSPEDRELLRRRFGEGSTVPQIARDLGIAQRSLYTRIERCLRELRRGFEARGFSRDTMLDLAAWPRLEVEMDFGLS